jgi:hypothetical protein
MKRDEARKFQSFSERLNISERRPKPLIRSTETFSQPDAQAISFLLPSLPPPSLYSRLPSPIKDGIHSVALVFTPQIDDRTDFPNGIVEDMRVLVPWLFTDKCLIGLNPAR